MEGLLRLLALPAMMRAAKASAADTAPSKQLPTYYGAQSLHELMERTTWHCGQHVRQYMMLLEKEGVSHHQPLKPPDFTKLPFPQNVWDG